MKYYSEKAHDRALDEHDKRWEQMHRAGMTEGRDSDTYRRLRQDVVDAMRVVRFEARRPKGRHG